MKALAMVGRLLPCYGPRASLEKALRERDEARNDSVRLVSDVQRLVGERDRLRADLDQSTKYNACQIENVAEGMRYAGVLREALIGVLSLYDEKCYSVFDVCTSDAVCAAWRALGLPGHFDPAALPLTRGAT